MFLKISSEIIFCNYLKNCCHLMENFDKLPVQWRIRVCCLPGSSSSHRWKSLICKLKLLFFCYFYFFLLFLKSFFLIWTIFKVLVAFVIILFLFYVLVFFGHEVCAEGLHPLTPHSNRDGPVTPALEGKVLTPGSPRKSMDLLYPWRSLQKWLACHRINGISYERTIFIFKIF